MKVSEEKIENSQVVLNIEVEPAETEDSLEVAYRRLVKKASVPGFRKGKAPRDMLERYLGKEALLEDALKHLVPKAYNQAIEEQKIEAVAQPEIEITQTDPVIFKATVAVRPTIELGDYQHIRIDPEPVEVTEDGVDAVIERLRYQHAPWEPVERPVQFNDLVTINVKGSLDGKPLPNQEGVQYHVAQGSPVPVPGFAEQLQGMGKEEEKEFSLSFPSDYPTSELAGKDYSFQVVVTEIKEKKLAVLDDEFAKSVGEGFESLDLLREQLSANLRAEAEGTAKRRFEERVVEAVVDLAQLEYPPIFVEQEVDHILSDQARHFRGGQRGLEDYLRVVKKTEEELREELRPLATKQVVRSLVLSKIAEEEKIEVSTTEIDAEVESMATSAGEKAEEVRKLFSLPEARQSLEQLLISRKTMQRLVEIASAEETEK